MLYKYPTFLIFSLGAMLSIAPAQEPTPEQIEEESNLLPALKVLPAGSVLSGVKIPRYNKNYTPASMLKAESITIISKSKIKGTSVDLTLYDKMGNLKGGTNLDSIYYDQRTGLLTSKENFIFSSPELQTTSQGLILDWKNNRGFFLGKNHTIIYLKESTSMQDTSNTPKSKNMPAKTIAAIAATSIAATATALDPLTDADIAELNRLSQPSTAKIEQLNQATQSTISQAEHISKTTDQNKATLIQTIQNSDDTLLTPSTTIQAGPKAAPELKPEAGKDHFSIKSDGNVFFDAKEGMMVFTKNVTVTHPDYNFSCDGEVKIVLAPKQRDKKLTPEELEKLKPNERFGDISKIIAVDNVVINGKDKDGKPITAVAGTLVYDHTSGVILLRGLNSRITMPDKQLKVINKNGHIKIDRLWNVSGQGTQIDLNVEELKKNQ